MLGGSRKDRAFINLEETNEKRSREMLKLLVHYSCNLTDKPHKIILW